jgi:hypothetical protein
MGRYYHPLVLGSRDQYLEIWKLVYDDFPGVSATKFEAYALPMDSQWHGWPPWVTFHPVAAGKECDLAGRGRRRSRFAFESQICYNYGQLEVLPKKNGPVM